MEAPGKLEVLYDAPTLAARIAEMGAQITEDFRGEELVIICVLKGSFMFTADLVRHIDLPCEVDFLGLSSYGDDTKSSGVVRFTKDLSRPIEGKSVLIVEDIIDTGLTMKYLLDNFETRGPKRVEVATLLHKPANQRIEVPIAYKGFTIDDLFVIGYGLDLAERYRNLPYVGHIVS